MTRFGGFVAKYMGDGVLAYFGYPRSSLRALENEYHARIEQDKRHSETLLQSLLPPEIATRLRSGASNIADYFDESTFIFAGGRLWPSHRQDEAPRDRRLSLNRLFSEFDKVAEDVGVEKIKTIGDN